jgi:hypothetical protein
MFLLKSIRLERVNKILVSAKIIGAEVLFIILGNLYIKEKVGVPKQNLVGLHVLL